MVSVPRKMSWGKHLLTSLYTVLEPSSTHSLLTVSAVPRHLQHDLYLERLCKSHTVVLPNMLLLFLCPVPDLSHCPSNGNETSQGVDEGISRQIFQRLYTHCSGTKTCKEQTIPFLFLTPLLGQKGAKAIHTAEWKWLCRLNTIYRKVCHPLLFCGSSSLSANYTSPYITGDSFACSNDPVSVGSDFIEGLPSSLVLGLLVAVTKNETCYIATIRQDNWMSHI